jgi:hypothetical protein
MKKKELFKSVMENAIDFLSKSIEDFDTSLKYSIIHFHSSIELLLKARLMAEHWSLVVSSKKEADLDNFLIGNFESVNMSECLSKLKKVAKVNISKEFEKSIISVTKHRNKTMHFFHEAHDTASNQKIKSSIAKEQLRCFYQMNQFILSEQNIFAPWLSEINGIAGLFKKQKNYLQIVFEQKQDQISQYLSGGNGVKKCPSCGFDSMTNVSDLNSVNHDHCFVCEAIETSLRIECPKCEKEILFQNEGYATCVCGTSFDPDSLANLLQSEKIGPGEIVDSMDQLGNCSECDGHMTVAPNPDGGYICTSCFETFDKLEICDWCNIPNTGDMSFTGIQGCNFCDGSSGYD